MNKYWLTVEGIGEVVLLRDYDRLRERLARVEGLLEAVAPLAYAQLATGGNAATDRASDAQRVDSQPSFQPDAVMEQPWQEIVKNAARYLWLRNCCDRNDMICPCCGYDGLDLFDSQKLDANIDAAMTADQQADGVK